MFLKSNEPQFAENVSWVLLHIFPSHKRKYLNHIYNKMEFSMQVTSDNMLALLSSLERERNQYFSFLSLYDNINCLLRPDTPGAEKT